MSNRGTPQEVNSGQMARIVSNLTLALPGAIERSGASPVEVLEATAAGERLSILIGKMLKKLTYPKLLPVENGARFVPRGWKVERYDERNRGIKQIDPKQIVLRPVGTPMTGYECIEKASPDQVLLDLGVRAALLKYPLRIPHKMASRLSGVGMSRVFFDGLTASGRSFFLYYHPSREAWEEDDFPLERVRHSEDFVAVFNP